MARKLDAAPLQATYILEGEHLYNAPAGEVLMDDPRSAFYERPMGFYSEELRQRFIDSSVRIAGVGGGGLTLAAMLAKEGVADFSIADIDRVDATNVGRIPMLTPSDIGREKVEVAAELITKHNPSARVRVYDAGVQEENVEEFVGFDAGNKGLTVVFDEVDLNAPEAALRLHRAARKFGKFVVAATDVDRGGMVTTFKPDDLRHTFEHYTGSNPDASVDEYLKKVTGFQLPTIPNIPKNATWGTFDATMKKAPLPTTLRSVLNATDLALDEFEKLLTLDDRRYAKPHFYPEIHAVNPSAEEDFVTRIPRVRSVLRVGQALLKDRLGLNPPTSYSLEEQAARIAYREAIAEGRAI